MRTHVGALVVIAVLAGCAAQPGDRAASDPTPMARKAGAAVGTHGFVRFVSLDIGWVVAAQPRLGRTVVYRTSDGGATWAMWGSVSGMAYPQAVGPSEVVLLGSPKNSLYETLLRSADGATWETLPIVPVRDVRFLPDLKIGWLVDISGNDAVVYRTLDGGRHWTNTGQQREAMPAYTPQFWDAESGFSSAFENCVPNGSSDPCDNNFRYTFDAGATWSPIELALTHAQKHAGFVRPRMPTMLDGAHGLMPVTFGPEIEFLRDSVYVSGTSDRGVHWSTPRFVRLPAAGDSAELTFLSLSTWVYAGTRIGDKAFVTGDGGATWTVATGMMTAAVVSSAPYSRRLLVAPIDRRALFLTSYSADIEWVEASSDSGTRWRPVTLPDLREPAWTGL